MMVGMSQDKLAEALGLTFQQVQKYEKGANRIGASRLFHIAQTLDVPVQFFYEDINNEGYVPPGMAEEPAEYKSGQDADMLTTLSTPEGMQLCKAYLGIHDPSVRRKVLDLIKTLSDEKF